MKAIIYGAGSIGALKPDNIDSPDTQHPLTHAHALFNLKEKYNLIEDFTICDMDGDKEERAKEKWGCGDVDPFEAEMFVVAVDTENHYNVMKHIISNFKNTKIIICEKPFCKSLAQAHEIEQLAKSKGIKIVVAYQRRFLAEYHNIRGEAYSCHLTYTRGLKREACHFIDLCNLWFGEFMHGKILSQGYEDYEFTDKTYPVYMKYTGCDHIFLAPVNGNKYSIFEIDILFKDERRITLVDNGKLIRQYKAEKEKIYGNYKSIPATPKNWWVLSLESAFMNMYSEILLKKRYDVSNTRSACAVHKVYDELFK